LIQALIDLELVPSICVDILFTLPSEPGTDNMDTSIDEDTSISPSGPSRHRGPGLGLGLNVHGAQLSPETSYEYPQASGGYDESSQLQVNADGDVTADADAAEEEGDEDGDAKSETSSAEFDPDTDPEGFARRQDELAGTLEVGEQEARALRWGPAIGRERDGTSHL
jgi:hypothetical protein